ncbi:TPA: hypothetical protein KPG21_001977 [Clostridioides difficile]|nr:hypothetical protein [Clostridioides difficile]MCR1515741.1 hypothetical protein [Clostridioides difficile]MDI6260453.1 hypothetical protein [Clostridioides difficile]HAU4872111.1 hypothetical protein [Clostridioides difficile]HBG1027190.1 hypothetical protein [Clostridioides difficile]
MEIIKVRLSELKEYEKNVRIHPETQIKEYIRSLERYGQLKAAIIDESNNILIGNGLYQALRRMGEEYIYCSVQKGLSENEKKKLMMSDNKLYSLGVDNLEVIDEILKELNGDLDIAGYDPILLQQIVGEAEEVTEEIMNYGIVDEEEINSMRASQERKESIIKNIEEAQQNQNVEENINTNAHTNFYNEVNDNSTHDFNNNSYREEQRSGQEIQQQIQTEGKFVICTKCGEKIWL